VTFGLDPAPVVRETTSPTVHTLDPEARRIIKEVKKFLVVADKPKMQHLLRQLRWLREAKRNK